MGWEGLSIADLAAQQKNAIVGGPFGSNLVTKDYVPTGVPVIRGQNLTVGKWVGGEFVFVSEDKADSLSANIARPGDLVFTQRGNAVLNGGQVAIVPAEPYPRYVISQSQMKLSVDSTKVDREFLLYEFKSKRHQHYLRTNAIVAGVPHTNLGLLKDYRIRLPFLVAQRSIATTLGTLDDKIELNRRMNRTLEAMAQAIFKSWFVDFEPVRAKAAAKAAEVSPAAIERAAMAAIAGRSIEEAIAQAGYFDNLTPSNRESLAQTAALFPDAFQTSELGEIPEGWESDSMDSLCALNPESWTKKDHPRQVEYIDLANTKNGEIHETQRYDWDDAPSRARRITKAGDSIVGTVRPGNRSFSLIPETCCGQLTASTGFSVVRPKESHLWEFNYIALTSDANIERLAQLADGAAYPAARPDVVAAFSLVIPKEELLKAFSKVAKPLFDLREENSNQSHTLAHLRDTLLPKLLSGELAVPEAEPQTEEALT